mmetsp:Transcript_2517/g.7466  ORF Transcript_2517/g.7466 Transcript_2517/m.7466 type:complete len:231 (-) Transcript_2517:869-1561(-)
MAPSLTSCSTAFVTEDGFGGSNNRAHTEAARPPAPLCNFVAWMRSTSCSSGTLRTSGGWWSSSRESWRCRVIPTCTANPGATRPARPRRCLAFVWETTVSSKDDIRRTASYLISFILPVSMTYPMSSMVTEVSATFVDRTTFLTPAGGLSKTFFWSSEGSDPCSGKTQARAGSCWNSRVCNNSSCTLSISLAPDRKTSTPEGLSGYSSFGLSSESNCSSMPGSSSCARRS